MGEREWSSSVPDPADSFDVVITALVCLLVLLAPLSFGSVAAWAKNAIFLCSLLLLALWLLQASRKRQLAVRAGSLWILLGIFFSWGAFQVVPLPPGILQLLSPGTSRLYAGTLPGIEGSRALTLSSHDTLSTLVVLGGAAIVFFVVVNVVRRRWQVMALLLAIVAVGTAEAIYGFAEQFSGHGHIFWNPRSFHLEAVTGTYHNKNFFSGLLEMTVPVGLGLLLAFSRAGTGGSARTPALRGRVAGLLSSRRTYQQLLLGSASIIMILAILFSLSRAGAAILGGIMAVAVIVLGFSSGFRRHTLIVFLVAGLALSIGSAVGMDHVITGMEDVVAGHSDSWLHRLDMSRSAAGIVRDLPLAGTGLGAMGRIFTRYQSRQLGDTWVEHIHNDWLQLAGEAGLVGWSIAMVLLGRFLFVVIRAARRRRDPFVRFVFSGLLTAVGAMLLHSFVEHNLGKVPANLLVFAVIAGLAWAVTHLPSGGNRDSGDLESGHRLSLASPLARLAAVAAAVGLMGGGVAWSIPRIRADLSFNRYLAASGRADPYFFLPLGGEEGERGELLLKALVLDPDNPEYHYHGARYAFERGDAVAEARAKGAARALVGEEVETADPEGFRGIVEILLDGARAKMVSERRPFLEEARASLLQAIDLSPTKADYHIMMAQLLFEEGNVSGSVRQEIAIARRLAPNVPKVQFGAGQLLLALSSGTGSVSDGEERLGEALPPLLRAVDVDPSYLTRVYRLLRGAAISSAAILEVMPASISAHEGLYLLLEKEGKWEVALACLGEIERLTDLKFAAAGGSPGKMPAPAKATPASRAIERYTRVDRGFDWRTELEVRLSLAERKSRLLAILGRWPARAEEVTAYRAFLRERLGGELKEARRARRQGRAGEAMVRCLRILEEDWTFPDALLEAAELASLPQVAGDLPRRQTSLDHLFRLVIYSERIAAGDFQRLRRVLDRSRFEEPAERVERDFIVGSALILAGQTAEGIEELKNLAGRKMEEALRWRQRHLIWYYLGLGLERQGRAVEAVEAYERALDLVATHRPSLARLDSLEEERLERLQPFEPSTPLNISFGGRIVLLGYDVEGEGIRFYWQFVDRMAPDYRVTMQFGDVEGRPAVDHTHRILTDSGREYPAGSPRSGEVVVEDYRFPPGRGGEPFLRVAVWMAGFLSHDSGHGFVVASLRGEGPSLTGRLP